MSLPSIGTKVRTQHGTGQVVGIDLPNSHERIRRAIVQITEPTEAAAEMVARFKDQRLCYFDNEVQSI